VIAWLRGRRSVPVFYDVNDEYAQRFERIIAAFEQLAHSQRIWHIAAQGSVDESYQRKVHGGATSVMERSIVTTITEAPKPMTTNVVVPGLVAGSRSLHFLPDQVLVRDRKRFASIPYDELKVECAPSRFIEGEPPPTDSTQV